MHRATWEQGKDQACGDRRQAGRVQTLLCGEDGGLWESGLGNWGTVTWFQNGGRSGRGWHRQRLGRDSIVWVNIVTWMSGSHPNVNCSFVLEDDGPASGSLRDASRVPKGLYLALPCTENALRSRLSEVAVRRTARLFDRPEGEYVELTS